MAEYQHTATADISADELYAFLSHPENLPRYFPQMKVAESRGGESVHVEADVHGERVEGEAWLRTDPATRSLKWGAEGPDDYRGELRIDEAGPAAAQITVTLNSVREADADEVQQGLEQTVAAITHAASADADVEAAQGQGGWTSYDDND
ncbi:SRPBCC family protein [Amycolatopsis sp., V23-08]|uniref:SRPBCC family protein n=1 Tax=Amycolatopsis heterodermiae TaxID=3110235 RepID=A0ABU5RGA9_9PSEU|nr:SRPBCC family protein [Amycolatopsis sp., V23-08]MEA5364176.1 SRPBCC family protein [Amycolatopsis sp., V23-08]